MSTADESAQDLLALLPLLNRMMIAELRQNDSDDTTMPQFRVLSYLAEEPLTLSVIARRRRVSLQSAGELVQALVDRGWVTRVADPNDRRQTLLHLTEAGIQQYELANRRMLTHLIPLMDNLSSEEMAAVQVALHALRRVLAGEQSLEEVVNDSQ
jgi:DNA-binding MarR family transcriptional regulator